MPLEIGLIPFPFITPVPLQAWPMCHVRFDGSLHHCNSRRGNTIFILVCKNIHRFLEEKNACITKMYVYMLLIPSQSLYLLHESLCSMPNPLELLKSQLTACIEQALRLLAVKTFFCAALQLFLGGTHHFFRQSSLQFIVLANSSQCARTTPYFGALMASFTM